MTVLLVALGGALGAGVRLVVSRLLPGARGTLAVNATGSLALGLLAGGIGAAGRTGGGGAAYALLGVGACGALTTFSTFAVEAVERPGTGAGPDRSPTAWAGPRWTVGYASVTVLSCLVAAAAGLALR